MDLQAEISKIDSPEEKAKFIITERQRRMFASPDYVALPVPIPMQKLSTLAGVDPSVDIGIGWLVVIPIAPGEDVSAETGGRKALTLQIPREDVAEDFCYLLNQARSLRLEELATAESNETFAAKLAGCGGQQCANTCGTCEQTSP